jgi:hypothetical protein
MISHDFVKTYLYNTREEHGVFEKRSQREFNNEYLQNVYSHIILLESTVINLERFTMSQTWQAFYRQTMYKKS